MKVKCFRSKLKAQNVNENQCKIESVIMDGGHHQTYCMHVTRTICQIVIAKT